MTAIPKVSLLLRSVYLKGHMDGHKKISDMSWEEDILFQLRQMVGELKIAEPQDRYYTSRIDQEAHYENLRWNDALDSVMEKLK